MQAGAGAPGQERNFGVDAQHLQNVRRGLEVMGRHEDQAQRHARQANSGAARAPTRSGPASVKFGLPMAGKRRIVSEVMLTL